jgi:hypothetical protein
MEPSKAGHGIDFGHEFHGREHHFLVTRDALEHLAGETGLDEIAMVGVYNAHLHRIHAVAELLSRHSPALTRIVLDRSAFEA